MTAKYRGEARRDFLLIESYQYHGQVLLPLLDTLNVEGMSWTLLLNSAHFDRASLEARVGGESEIVLLEGSELARLGKLMSTYARIRPRHTIVMTCWRYNWHIFGAASLLSKSGTLVFHRSEEFPIPQGQLIGGPGQAFNALYWRLCPPRFGLILAERLREAFARKLPESTEILVFDPLVEAISEKPIGGQPLKLFMNGPLFEEKRDFLTVLEGLDRAADEVEFELVVAGGHKLVGGQRGRIEELFKARPYSRMHLDSWLSYQSFAQLAGGCHYLLLPPPRLNLGVVGAFEDSIRFLQRGLPRPLIRPREYGEGKDLLNYSSSDQLAAAVEDAALGLANGSWAEEVARMRAERARRVLENRLTLRRLLNRRESMPSNLGGSPCRQGIGGEDGWGEEPAGQ